MLLLQKIINSKSDISTHKSTLLATLTQNFTEKSVESGALILINDCICLLLRDIDETSLAIINLILSKAIAFINYLSTRKQ